MNARINLEDIIPTDDLMLSVDAELCCRSLKHFIMGAWHVLEPVTPFADNWHIDVICEHLEAVSRGDIKRLIINMPPRCMKSLIISVCWPAWEWINKPHSRWLVSSYGQTLAERDALKTRMLIDSPWFQARFGHVFGFRADQNAKSRYENTKTGFRVSTSPDGMGTGEGGDFVNSDDPHNVKQVESEAKLLSTITWWDETMSSRYNDPKTGRSVIVMQRVKENDLCGHLLAKGGWEHLCIPMEFDGIRRATSLGSYDPRTEEGELLWPGRFDADSVKKLKAALGTYATACQLQQTPTPRGGGIFKRADFRYYKTLPTIEEIVISADLSFKGLDTSDRVAIQAWGIAGPNKYLLHRVADKLGFTATIAAIKSVVAKFPNRTAILIEDKANGPAVIETLRQSISGIIAINPDGGKEARAFAMQPEHEGGNVYIPDPEIDPTIEDYVHEMCGFPNAAHDDEVDATTQMFNWDRQRGRTSGMLDYMEQQYAAMMAAKGK